MKIATLLFLVTFCAHAGAALKAIPSASEVSFVAVGHPSMLKIHGKAEGPEGAFRIQGLNLVGSAEVAMEKFTTGIEMRDKHMKEKYLETGTYPKAVLTVQKASVPSDFETNLSAAGDVPFEGTLNLHGKEQPVKGLFTAKSGTVDAKFPIKLDDFAIAIPSYLGATVADTVDVEAKLVLRRE